MEGEFDQGKRMKKEEEGPLKSPLISSLYELLWAFHGSSCGNPNLLLLRNTSLKKSSVPLSSPVIN